MLRRTLIAGALVPLAVALPASAHHAGPAPARVPGPALSPGHPPPAGSPFTTRAVNRAAARAWAARLVSELRLPPAAARSAGDPAGAGRSLASPGFALTTPESVDDTTWWTIDAPASAVVAFLRAHRPRELRLVAHSVGSEPGRVTDAFWSYAAPPGLLQLTAAIQTAALAGGRTAVRLDGEATWLVPRPAWDRVPGAVHSVTYTARATIAGLDGGRASHGRRSAPRTLGARDARRLAMAVDRLQRYQPGVAYSCPFDPVQPRITLRFHGPGGRRASVAVDLPSGCPSVRLTVHGRRGPALNEMAAPLTIAERMVALGAIRACRAGQLSAGPAALALAARRPTLTLSVRNRSDAVCTVRGFARVALVGARGHALARRQRRIDPRALRRAGLAGTVILYPGTAAQFTARYTTCPARTPAVTARIRIPGAAGALSERLASSGRRVTPCRRTRLWVSALSTAL
jgi:hypothetical protein